MSKARRRLIIAMVISGSGLGTFNLLARQSVQLPPRPERQRVGRDEITNGIVFEARQLRRILEATRPFAAKFDSAVRNARPSGDSAVTKVVRQVNKERSAVIVALLTTEQRNIWKRNVAAAARKHGAEFEQMFGIP